MVAGLATLDCSAPTFQPSSVYNIAFRKCDSRDATARSKLVLFSRKSILRRGERKRSVLTNDIEVSSGDLLVEDKYNWAAVHLKICLYSGVCRSGDRKPALKTRREEEIAVFTDPVRPCASLPRRTRCCCSQFHRLQMSDSGSEI